MTTRKMIGVGILPIIIGLLALVVFSQTPIPVRMIVVASAADAQEIVRRLDAGADFAMLARERSIDPTSVDGGLLGRIDPNGLRPELRDALKGVAPGEISKIVKTQSGYAVLKVLTEAESAKGDANPGRQAAVLAQGSVHYSAYVAGFDEAVSALVEATKPAWWGQNLKEVCAGHLQSVTNTLVRLEEVLGGGSELRNIKPVDLIQLYMAAGQLHVYRGDMAHAISQFEAAYRVAKSSYRQAMPTIEEFLGISYLHKSEMDNDVYRFPGDRCLFPMRPDLRYAHTGDSAKAVQYFTTVLDRNPADVASKWMLNLAYMTMGQYPSAVPQKYLMPLDPFQSGESVGRFIDVAPQAGLNLFAMASGVVVDDFDNDGLMDVMTSTMDACEPMHYFHNNGDGKFTDQAVKAGLKDQLGGLNLVQTDYNNDGCTDILVLRGAWERPGQRKSLLKNNCNGTFTDVTKQAGLVEPVTNTQAAAWADINNDGLLDVFVGNEQGPSQLFLNNGDGTFKDISHLSGIDRSAFTKGVAAADYDGDGYVDFYVANENTVNFLYHNNRDGTFTDVARQAGVQGTSKASFATWFFDYDNDGLPDIFVNSYFSSVEETLATYLGMPHKAGTLKLFRNLGNGAFRDVTKETGLDKVYMPMGANFGDIDNDGYSDIYLGTGSPSYGSLVPNVLLRNREGKSFVDVTASSGTGELHKGHGVAFADIDNDGDVDIITSIGGATPGDKHAFRLFENPGNGNDWINLKLVGVKANHAAIGARIKVVVKDAAGMERTIYKTVNSGGSFGGSPLEQHVGLGKAAAISRIEILWPDGSKEPQVFANMGVDQTIQIRQFDASYTKLERHPLKLGGEKPR